MYHYGFIFSVLPMQPETLSYILRSPRIIKLSLTLLYLLTSTGILIKSKVVLSKAKKIVVSCCTAWAINNYLCLAKLHTLDIHCINNFANCLYKSKYFNEIFYNYIRLSYSIVSNFTCKISSAYIISKFIRVNGFYCFIKYFWFCS